MTAVARALRAFGHFWWDFLVGDTPELAVATGAIVGLAFLLAGARLVGAILLPLVAAAFLFLSTYRGRRRGTPPVTIGVGRRGCRAPRDHAAAQSTAARIWTTEALDLARHHEAEQGDGVAQPVVVRHNGAAPFGEVPVHELGEVELRVLDGATHRQTGVVGAEHEDAADLAGTVEQGAEPRDEDALVVLLLQLADHFDGQHRVGAVDLLEHDHSSMARDRRRRTGRSPLWTAPDGGKLALRR